MHFTPVRIASPLVSGAKTLGKKLRLDHTLAVNAIFALGLAELSKLKRRERKERAQNAARKAAEPQEARPSSVAPERAIKESAPRLLAPTKPVVEPATPVKLPDPVIAVAPTAPKHLCAPRPDYRHASRPPGPTIRAAMPRAIIKVSAPRAQNDTCAFLDAKRTIERKSVPSTLKSGFLCGCGDVFYVSSQSEIDTILAAKKQGQKPRCPTCVRAAQATETAA